MGDCSVANVTSQNCSVSVTGSPLNDGKIAETIAGGQVLMSSLPAR